jgi:phenylalanyl-tRNA synthetase beta chain
MRVQLSWMREFVDVPGTPEEIAARMSVRGFAVEGIDPAGSDPTADAVLDFEITANRPDCMSVIGIAREVATAYSLPLEAGPPAAGPALQTAGPRRPGPAEDRPGELTVVIENPELCPRYVGALAEVKVGPSPAWMQERLQHAGIRPISNIVDITNYVLLELGQPMHAFDYASIAGGEIRVRNARPGERLRTLDNQTRELTADMLVIADAGRATAVAGVMGGSDSEVHEATQVIAFESAYFDPLSVRRTSRKLGLKTEASMRFERGADPNLPARAMARALELLEQIGAGTPRGLIVDAYPNQRVAASMRLRRAKIGGLLGTEVPDADIARILESLGFDLHAADGPAASTEAGWDVGVPTRRVDILREVDLIEEVARHYGFDQLPSTFPPLLTPPPPADPRLARARQLRGVMAAAGFFEAVTFGFIAEAAATPFAAADDLVPIANPLNENFAVLRPSALPGIIDAVARNRNRQQRDIRLFEIGNRFTRRDGERRALACAWTGAGSSDHWSGGSRDVDFFDMKGVVARVYEAMRVDARTEPHRESWLAPGRTAAVVSGGTRIGVLGQLAPAIAERHGLPATDPIYVAELDLDAAEQASRGQVLTVEALPRYPSVTRDISILVDDTLAAEQVRATIQAAAPPTLVRVREFDRYQGKGVPDGKTSLSLRLTFRSSDRTLTDSEVQSAMDAVLSELKARHAAVQR